MNDQIMIDFETLSTRSDAIVLSVGLVKFDLNADPGKFGDWMYQVISIEDQERQGRHRCPNTEKFWADQDEAARAALELKTREPLENSLDQIFEFFGFEDYCVWGNGADFDNAILQHMLSTNGYEPPWKFSNNRCFRTYKAMFGHLVRKPSNLGLAHHALDDAKYQAMYCQEIHQKLQKIGAVK